MPIFGDPPLGGTGTTTVSMLIEETKRILYGTVRMTWNAVGSTPIGASDTTITLANDLNEAVRGSLIAIEDELMYVTTATAATKQLTVIRGVLGTTAASHIAATLVEVNPRFPRIYIKRALQQEIDSWGTKLFKVSASNISFSSTTRVYDLGISDFINIINVQLSPYTGRTTRSSAFRWQILRDEDTSIFPSGSAIELLGDVPTSGTMRIKASQRFDVSAWTDALYVESLGLTSGMIQIPPVGAAWRLMIGKEIGRTNLTAQPEPRKAEEVPAGHMASVAAQLKKLRDDLIDEQRWTLMQRYPLKGVA